MRLLRLAETTEAVRATSSRTAKAELLADTLRELAPAEIVPAIGMLLAKPRQGAIGVGWATVARLDRAAEGAAGDRDEPNREADILGFDGLLSEIATTTGPGSEGARAGLLRGFLARCEPPEADFVRRVLVGDARQGALAGVMTDAAAKASGAKVAAMRRAAMLRGDLAEAAAIALIDGPDALDGIDLEVGRPIQPMLASTSPGVEEAVESVGHASVEWKLDGARIQVHVDGGRVSIWTRNLNDITSRLPQVVTAVLALPCDSAVLDGEVLGFHGDDDTDDTDGTDDTDDADADADDETIPDPAAAADAATGPAGGGDPRAFQQTMQALGTTAEGAATGLRPYFFDLMFLDGVSLIDRPLRERLAALHGLAPDALVVPQRFTDDVDDAKDHLDAALVRGHEGVMVKAADGRYEAGRRGKSWRKVKPVHTLDLVVLAAEWGHGRRRGWLSNLHLGARDPDGNGFVMVGKTFKGLTDDLLTWQTSQLLERKVSEAGITVHVEPELVVEIALDGAQVSTRYPGGVALRFARVRGYRPDRDAASADTLDAVRGLLPGART